MAQLLVELSNPIFKSIGALTRDSGGWRVAQRPLTLNMNELVRVGNLPSDKFTQNTFSSATAYFADLANQQLRHLRFKRKGAVEDEQECRRKYIAWCLFKRIVQNIVIEGEPPSIYISMKVKLRIYTSTELGHNLKSQFTWV